MVLELKITCTCHQAKFAICCILLTNIGGSDIRLALTGISPAELSLQERYLGPTILLLMIIIDQSDCFGIPQLTLAVI